MRKGVPMTEEHKAKIKAGREAYLANKRKQEVEKDCPSAPIPATESWVNLGMLSGNEIDKKLDAILDVLSANVKTATDLAQLTVALAPLREKISKLHMARYAGKEFSPAQLVGMVGVETLEGKVEENRIFWENLKIAMIDALLRIEGFKIGTPGHYKVGEL